MMNLKVFQNSEFDRGAGKWVEVAWYICRSLLFASWFPVPSGLKTACLRWFGAKIGRGVVIRSRVNITFPWKLTIGDHAWIGDEVFILSLDHVTIGSNVCISQRAFLCTGSHEFSKPTFDLITRPIVIEDGCWIGAQSFIGPGVRFGVSSRSLAGSVVIQEVLSNTTVGGVPAVAKSLKLLS